MRKMSESMPPFARTRRLTIALLLVAISLPIAARLAAGPRGAVVHVRWQSSVDPAARSSIVERLGLTDGQRQDEQTWRYDLIEASRDRIRALVLDPAVADTHYIDRAAYSIDPSAERTPRLSRFRVMGPLVVETADWAALILVALAALVLSGPTRTWRRLQGLVSSVVLRLRQAVHGAATALARWFGPWVPALDARALGAFRIMLGCGFVWIAWTFDVNPRPLALQKHFAAFDWSFVHTITATPGACNAVEAAMLVAAVLFTIGLWTRWAYTAFVAAFFLLTLVALESSGAHDRGLPLVTFLGWLAVPWGNGLSIDRRRQARAQSERGADMPSRVRGFAIWWPGFTLGVGLLAAAHAKVTTSGFEWITGGAVRYHFIADAGNAHVDWGLWVASHPWAAVLVSFAAVAVEAGFILHIFARGPGARLVAGATGVGLFVGLYLFQGINWPAWHVLLLAFLPWAWLNRVRARAEAPTISVAPAVLPGAQLAAIAVLIATQVYASGARIEAEPLLSNYPMYSNNYSSPQQFERSMRWRLTRLVGARADGRDIRATLDNLLDDDRFLLMDLAERPFAETQVLGESEQLNRSLLCEHYQQVMGTLPAEVTFAMERRGFDWNAGRFRDYTPLPTSPVRLAALCRAAATPQLAR